MNNSIAGKCAYLSGCGSCEHTLRLQQRLLVIGSWEAALRRRWSGIHGNAVRGDHGCGCRIWASGGGRGGGALPLRLEEEILIEILIHDFRCVKIGLVWPITSLTLTWTWVSRCFFLASTWMWDETLKYRKFFLFFLSLNIGCVVYFHCLCSRHRELDQRSFSCLFSLFANHSCWGVLLLRLDWKAFRFCVFEYKQNIFKLLLLRSWWNQAQFFSLLPWASALLKNWVVP